MSCVPLCSDDLQRPADKCPNPQLVRLPGRCCKEWVCDGLENNISSNPSAGKEAKELKNKTKITGNTFQNISLWLGYQNNNCKNKSSF